MAAECERGGTPGGLISCATGCHPALRGHPVEASGSGRRPCHSWPSLRQLGSHMQSKAELPPGAAPRCHELALDADAPSRCKPVTGFWNESRTNSEHPDYKTRQLWRRTQGSTSVRANVAHTLASAVPSLPGIGWAPPIARAITIHLQQQTPKAYYDRTSVDKADHLTGRMHKTPSSMACRHGWPTHATTGSGRRKGGKTLPPCNRA